jgi:two-component system CheB/CheR fusion protein
VRSASALLDPGTGGLRSHPLLGFAQRTPSARAPRAPSSAVDLGYQALVRAFAPPAAILVNAEHELVHFYGDVQRYVQLRDGRASLEVSRILPDPLIPVATALLFKANRENTSVTSDVLRLPPHHPGDPAAAPRSVRLSAWPVGEFEGRRLTLLAFEEVEGGARDEAPATIDVSIETSERLGLLEQELAATRESLQATIEELETSNEELQATNEELMASNEELQSSNEELQSVNEELTTVNAEYQEKIDILNRVNADLESLAKVVATGTVFVDDRLNLTRFSPDASDLFRLRDTDVGRPIADLNHRLDYPELMRDLRRATEAKETIERTVTGPDERFFLVRMLPYRIPSSSSGGVVVSFLDTTALHEANRLQYILDALAEHVAVLDHAGRILLVNRAWRDFARANGDAELSCCGPGISYLDVCRSDPGTPDSDYAERAREGVRAVLEGRRGAFSMEYPCHAPDEERWFIMHVRPMLGSSSGAVVSHVNITEWKRRADAALLRAAKPESAS